MQFGAFLVGGNVGVGIEKEWIGIESVSAAIYVSAAMKNVRAGSGAHINVRAAGGTLLGVIHAGIHAQFLDRFRSGSWQRLPDGEIRRCGALNHGGAGAGGAADAGVGDHPRGSPGTGALAIKKIAGVDTIQQKRVAGVALAVGPYRLVAEPGVGAGAAGKFGSDAGP